MDEKWLDQWILPLTDQDGWSARDSFEGTLITGSPGSGKTSNSGKNLAYALLKANPRYGALVLPAKAGETERWKGYLRDTGRGDDLILFNAESGHCFDPLFYEWNRPGRGAGDLERSSIFSRRSFR